ncbi:hypothetical protein [Planococcus faecalis]|uniref:Uncharacterized protein n=1 Tax=Planococcus faecalis TaxID=1598147 RepID=A0ABM6IP18_9BACL|nr:hypothetical protein [Planococcus faecalis]AQU78310.1 hypothetical protein AJGP001_02910 [Planococcus faecalis]OHX51304.1 hypothetical protein BB777_17330 [Planococcus faecalis]
MITTAVRPITIDQSTEYEKLSPKQKAVIQDWIIREVTPHKIKTFRGVTSYTIKHIFEDSKNGFYLTNGQMKGALDAADFEPKDRNVKNWEYALSWKVSNY